MLSLGAGSGSVFRIPGKRKSNGETEWDALIPPHPEQSNVIVNAMQNPLNFQFNFTEPYNIVRSFMLAISNSRDANPADGPQSRCKTTFFPVVTFCWLLAWMPMLMPPSNALAGDNADSAPTQPPDPAQFAKRAEKAFADAKTRFEADTNNAEAAWQFGRACYDWADYAATDTRRAEIARLGIAACRRLVEKDTNSALGHYYLAMDMG